MTAAPDGLERGPGTVRPPPCRRVLVVSAGMGAGHDMAAGELVRRLRNRGHVAERLDVLALGRPGQGARLQRTYAVLLRRLPWVYDLAMRVWARWPAPLETLTAHGARAYEEGLLHEVRRVDPDVVVTVYNLSSQALGRLRASGRLPIPTVTYVTDPGAHPYWLHPAVDLYLTMLPQTSRELQARGAARTCVVSPLVRPQFWHADAGREEARRQLGIPAGARAALVNGGSWATGCVEGTVHRLLRAGTVVPLTLCGQDDALRMRLERHGAGIPLGWTENLAPVMAAADVLVDNAGGLTCWEALASGLPVVSFRPLPGHGRLNAEALEAAGLAGYARSDEQLISLIGCAHRRFGDAYTPALQHDDPVEAILRLAGPTAGRWAA